jgi:iron complex transport system ATP-binding protein
LSSVEKNQSKTNSVIFSAHELSWRVGDHAILKKLSFDISNGEFVGIIGPNGAGKSSLLRCLYGKNTPSNGTLTFQSKMVQDFTRRELAQSIAVVVQEPPTNFDMNVSDVVAMGLIPHRPLLSFSTRHDLELIERAIEEVELQDKANADFNTLSGGEKQRVMIARAIVQQPDVLILDEPTNHLDVKHQIEVLQLAKNMGITVILSIHDLNIASAFCDRLLLMDEGEILANGSCANVLTTENLQSVFKIKATIDGHPFHQGQRITYDFLGGMQ